MSFEDNSKNEACPSNLSNNFLNVNLDTSQKNAQSPYPNLSPSEMDGFTTSYVPSQMSALQNKAMMDENEIKKKYDLHTDKDIANFLAGN